MPSEVNNVIFDVDANGDVERFREYWKFTGGVKTFSKRFRKPMLIKYNPSDDAYPTAAELGHRNIFLIMRRQDSGVELSYRWNCQIDYTDV